MHSLDDICEDAARKTCKERCIKLTNKKISQQHVEELFQWEEVVRREATYVNFVTVAIVTALSGLAIFAYLKEKYL